MFPTDACTIRPSMKFIIKKLEDAGVNKEIYFNEINKNLQAAVITVTVQMFAFHEWCHTPLKIWYSSLILAYALLDTWKCRLGKICYEAMHQRAQKNINGISNKCIFRQLTSFSWLCDPGRCVRLLITSFKITWCINSHATLAQSSQRISNDTDAVGLFQPADT